MPLEQSKKRVIVSVGSTPYLTKHIKLHHDQIRDQWVLLAPERIHELVGPAVDIIKQCDGVNSVGEIIASMCSEYNAPKDEVQSDVIEMLQSLSDKNILVI